jgi:hypothetical protein
MFDVAFARRMCCSRVWNVRVNARFPRESILPHSRDSSRHPPEILFLRGEHARRGTAEAHRETERLRLPDRDVGTVSTRRVENRERREVHRGDEQGPALSLELRAGEPHVFENPVEVRMLEDDRDRAPRGLRPELGHVGAQSLRGKIDERHACRLQRRLEERAQVRMEVRGHQDSLPFARRGGEQHRFGECRASVVHRGVCQVHSREPRHDRLELVDHLKSALAHFGLIRRVRRRELGPRRDGTGRRGNAHVVHAAADEADERARGVVFRRELRQAGQRLRLGDARFDRQTTFHANRGRDVGDELVERGDTDRAQHGGAVGIGVLNERRHACSAPMYSAY